MILVPLLSICNVDKIVLYLQLYLKRFIFGIISEEIMSNRQHLTKEMAFVFTYNNHFVHDNAYVL